MGFGGFEELAVWQKSRLLKLEIRELVQSFPPEEKLIYFKNKITEVEKMLNGYISYLEKRAKS